MTRLRAWWRRNVCATMPGYYSPADLRDRRRYGMDALQLEEDWNS